MRNLKNNNESGFTFLELLISMTIIIILMGVVSLIFGRALGVKSRESSRTDALTSAQAALNVMSREIANSGYGLADSTDTVHDNGIVLADSNSTKLRVRSNVVNNNTSTSDVGEDVTYYYDSDTLSIVRHDPAQNPSTTYLVNRISNVFFEYYNYTGSSSTPTVTASPTVNTSRVKITVTVNLEKVQGQPNGQTITLTSDVTLRNSNYMMSQY